jgi:hypothetical protein
MKTFCLSLCVLLATPNALYAQEKSPEEMQESCRNYVRGFYNWYSKHGDVGGALKRYAFSPELSRLLKKDQEAGVIDFDRFLATNGDEFQHYIAGKVTLKSNTCWVGIPGLASRKKSAKPVVTPELLYKDGRWLFVNFLYGPDKGDDLLSMLRNDFREERRKHSR